MKLLFFTICCLFFSINGQCIDSQPIQVLVSVAPQKYVVKQIGGHRVNVTPVVPLGFDSHSYEPTPRRVLALQSGEIWFRLGDCFEKRLIPLLKHMRIVDQRENVELLFSDHRCSLINAADPHIWLSPKALKKQAEQIADVLSSIDPDHASLFANNLHNFKKILENLDLEVQSLLATGARTILVSHPAFGYFCHDYKISQLSIEMAGKEPTPFYLTKLIESARNLAISTIFLQANYPNKAGKQLADALNAQCIMLDPYAEDVVSNIRTIAHAFSQS